MDLAGVMGVREEWKLERWVGEWRLEWGESLMTAVEERSLLTGFREKDFGTK
jgi:hypothetical protein